MLKEKTVFNKFLHLTESSFGEGENRFERVRVKRPESAAILVYNTDQDSIVLVKQFRYAVWDKTDDLLLEVPAGLIDANESPRAAACRECLEESGYKIEEDKLEHLASFFVSPGYTSELMHLYFAQVGNSDKKEDGGGKEDEHEDIQLIHLPSKEFLAKEERGELMDLKTLLAAQFFMHKRMQNKRS